MVNLGLFLVAISVYAGYLDSLAPGLNLKLMDDGLLVFLAFPLIIKATRRRASGLSSKLLNRPMLCILAFVLTCIVSGLLNTVALDVWMVQMRSYLLSLTLLFGLGMTRISHRQLIFSVRCLLLIALPVFLGGVYEVTTGKVLMSELNRFGFVPIYSRGFRAQSFIGNSLDFGIYALAPLALLAGMLLSKTAIQFRIKRWWFWGLVALIGSGLLFTGSRGPIVASIAGCCVLFGLGRVGLGTAIKVLLFAGVLLAAFGGTLVARFSQFSYAYFAHDEYRGSFLLKSLEAFKDSPIYGLGPGRFGGWVSINYEKSPLYAHYGFDTFGISSIDMFWPHVLVETGLLGMLSYCGFFFLMAQGAYGQLKHYGARREGALLCCMALALLFYLPAIVVTGLLSTSLESQLGLIQIAVLFGLFAGHYRYLNSQRPAPPEPHQAHGYG